MRLGMWSLPRATTSAKPCRAAQRARRTYQTIITTSATSIVNASITRRTHYQVLGVQTTASLDDIRTAFRRLAKSLHPDHNKLPGAREKFQEVKEAYDVLADISARADYDRELRVQAMAAAAAAAQTASGGRRASTTNVRRNRHTGPAKSQAATRPASGDDFDVFTATSASPRARSCSGSRCSPNGSGNDGYRSIFSEPQRATSSGGNNSNNYRSVFNGSSATAPVASSPPLPPRMAATPQEAAARSRSSQAGAATPGSGYKSIFDSGTPPRSASSGRTSGNAGSSNPCIFNGRAISPNLGTRKQTANYAAPAPATAAPYGSRTLSTPSSLANSSNGSRIGINAGNGTGGASEASNTAAASAASAAPSGQPAVPHAVADTLMSKPSFAPGAPGVGAAAISSLGGNSQQAAMGPASTSYTPYTVSPSIPGVSNPNPASGAATTNPAPNIVHSTAADVTSSPSGSTPHRSKGAAAGSGGPTSPAAAAAASIGTSIGDVASRLAAMTAVAAAGTPRSGSGGSGRGDYVSVFTAAAAATTQINASVASAPVARSSSPGPMINGGAVTDGTALLDAEAASTASFQVVVMPKVVLDKSGGRNSGVESASQPPLAASPPQPLPSPLVQQPQREPRAAATEAQLGVDDVPRHSRSQLTDATAASGAAATSSSALATEAEAVARLAAAMAAAAEAKAAAAAAEAMAAEAAAVAARAKAAAIAAEAQLSAVVVASAAGSALPPNLSPTTTETSTSGTVPTTADDDRPQGSEGTALPERPNRACINEVVPQVQGFVRQVGAFFAP
ncbi:hypothetical protein VaNZ11_015552 [Volvox africanus]|uniref:J domain-containing protein n=1 Tax=Volvox africanus TaxID=51714 RepID=A0ABQ5SLF2_9CHLO|nr:hypothetical protein VaNZ11_015552 [Volvox africanus]